MQGAEAEARSHVVEENAAAFRLTHQIIQSVAATGGVDKGQGRSQRELMICAY